MEYETLRQFADTWGLMGMVVIFVGIVIYVLRPGAKRVYRDCANIPLKDD